MGETIETVIPSVLLRSSRPGRDSDDESEVSPAAVDAWIEAARDAGARTILSFLDDSQLAYYRQLGPEGLLGRYRAAGFKVIHRPCPDGAMPPLSDEMLERISSDFLAAELPLLVHCSAGVDRTGAAVTYLTSGTKLQEFRRQVLGLMEDNSQVRKRGHFLRVTDLALRVFDKLEKLHGLAPRWRVALWAAAMLHDIGTAEEGPDADHPWRSGAMILAKRALLVSGMDQITPEAIATVAALHGIHEVTATDPLGRVKSPIKELWASTALPSELRILAGILRLADGLDRSQQQAVEDIVLEGETIKVIGKAGVNPSEDIWRASAKISLLSAALGRCFSVEEGPRSD